MTASLSIPPLPTQTVESDDETVLLFLPPILKAWKGLTELSADYQRVREANETAESELENSDHEMAVNYRNEANRVDEEIETLRSQMDDEIAKLRKAFKDAKTEKEKSVTDMRNSTLVALGSEAVADIDKDELAARYLKLYQTLTKTAKMIADDDGGALLEYVKKELPSRFDQTPGLGKSRGGNTGVRGVTPRFVSIVVNGEKVDPATLTQAAKHVGISAKEGGRKLILNRLLQSIVTWDNLSSDPENPNRFTLSYNDKVYNFETVAKAKASDSDDDDD